MERLASQFVLGILDRPYADLFPSKTVPWLALISTVIVVTVIYTILTYTALIDEDELPVNFTVPIPEQCLADWKGDVLEDPSIKAWYHGC